MIDEQLIMVGLEVHVRLLTESKMFCACPNQSQCPPNTLVCPICLGMPGTLPSPNKRAFELGMQLALALNCQINPWVSFDRKNYFYPDMPKNYQITQYYRPLAEHGHISVEMLSEPNSTLFTVPIKRLHLEEDAGRICVSASGQHLVDYNRAGVPLAEIVTEPWLGTPQQAAAFAKSLAELVRWLGVSDGLLEQGSLRVDVNVSIPGENLAPGKRCEIKNLNSFKAIERALQYESQRQRQLLADGLPLTEQTLAYNEAISATYPMRSKESAQDYGYMPEPDLAGISISDDDIQRSYQLLPELPAAIRQHLAQQLHVSVPDCYTLTRSRQYYQFFVDAGPSKAIASLLINLVPALERQTSLPLVHSRLLPSHLAAVCELIETKQITRSQAPILLKALYVQGGEPTAVAKSIDLVQSLNKEQLDEAIGAVLGEQGPLVEQYRAGNAKVLNVLIGLTIKRGVGNVPPQTIRELLVAKLAESRRLP